MFSRRQPPVDGDVRFVAGDVAAVHPQMVAAAGDRNVWVVRGGDLAGQFAGHGPLDEAWVQYAPVALGAGAPLLPRRLELELTDAARNRDFAWVPRRPVILHGCPPSGRWLQPEPASYRPECSGVESHT